jgi:RNA:NAD 2'-phosphotransferase (TPT1/KptA family)
MKLSCLLDISRESSSAQFLIRAQLEAIYIPSFVALAPISCLPSIDLPLVTSNIKNAYGTVERFIKSIGKDGLRPAERHHAHLPAGIDTVGSRAVGRPHGKPLILKMKALMMLQQGFKFFPSENGVLLTNKVPVEFTANIDNEQHL